MTTSEAQGLRLAYYRVVAGLTCGELAERAGVTAGTLRGWERGRYEIKCSVLPSMCNALDVTANEILMPDTFDPAEKMSAIVRTCTRARQDDAFCAALTRELYTTRQKRGLTRVQLAERAHMAPSDISRYEKNGYTLRPLALLRLYAALDMHYDPVKGEWAS